MRLDKQINEHHPRLLLCLAGWSASPDIFRHLIAPKDRDVWIAYDYRSLDLEADLSDYAEIHLIAWSLGVWVAERLEIDFTTATAVNGSPLPMDDLYGIPVNIFEGTLAHLDADGIRRFNRRMCGDSETSKRYATLPARSVEEAGEELRFLHDRILADRGEKVSESVGFWTRAIISTGDRIFPADNLRRYWQGRCPVKEIDSGHLPFFHLRAWEELWQA